MSRFYVTDPDDPEAPVELDEYHGLKPGDSVVYENPAWRQADGTYKTGGMDPPLVITAIFRFGEHDGSLNLVEAILNDGEWECSADNLRKEG